MRCTNGPGTDNGVLYTGIEIGLYRFLVTYATTNLNGQIGKGFRDRPDRAGIHRLALKSTVQIDHVQAARTRINPALCHLHRVVTKNSFIFHTTLPQAHTLAILQVNRGYQQHRSGVSIPMYKI